MHRVTVVAMVAMMIWIASFLVSVLLTLLALDEKCLFSIPLRMTSVRDMWDRLVVLLRLLLLGGISSAPSH